MTKKVLGLILAIGLLSGSVALAEEVGPGCGLGKVIFEGKKGILFQNLAWTSNVGTPTRIFGITSGTSGCDADSVILGDKEQETFVETNLDNLFQEMAQGDGVYLHGLASLMGCNSVVYSDFTNLTQEKYSTLVASADISPTELLSGLKRELAAHPTLSFSCNRISS